MTFLSPLNFDAFQEAGLRYVDELSYPVFEKTSGFGLVEPKCEGESYFTDPGNKEGCWDPPIKKEETGWKQRWQWIKKLIPWTK